MGKEMERLYEPEDRRSAVTHCPLDRMRLDQNHHLHETRTTQKKKYVNVGGRFMGERTGSAEVGRGSWQL